MPLLPGQQLGGPAPGLPAPGGLSGPPPGPPLTAQPGQPQDPSLAPGGGLGDPSAGPPGMMGAPSPDQMLSPAMKALYLQAAASAMAGALANLHNPAGAAAVTQTDAPSPPTLDQSYA